MNTGSVTTLPRLESAGLDGWMVRLFDSIEETNLPWITALLQRCESAFGTAVVDLVPSDWWRTRRGSPIIGGFSVVRRRGFPHRGIGNSLVVRTDSDGRRNDC